MGKKTLDLTPRQWTLIKALLRQESILNTMGEKHRATVVLQKLGEE